MTLFFYVNCWNYNFSRNVTFFIWAAKSGQFDDANKLTNGLLYDSVEDLNDAIRKEKNLKEAKQQKWKVKRKRKKKLVKLTSFLNYLIAAI